MSCQKFLQVNDRACEKIAFLKAIEERRDIIFRAFSTKLTNKDNKNAWKEVQKETLAQGFSKYTGKALSKLMDKC